MPKLRRCCVIGCESHSETHRVFNFPQKDKLRELWLSFVVPYNNKLREMTKKQLLNRHVCQKHFERRQFDGVGNRIAHGYPCLFTEMEMLHGVPLSSKSKKQSIKPTRPISPTDEDDFPDSTTDTPIYDAIDHMIDHNYFTKHQIEECMVATNTFKINEQKDMQQLSDPLEIVPKYSMTITETQNTGLAACDDSPDSQTSEQIENIPNYSINISESQISDAISNDVNVQIDNESEIICQKEEYTISNGAIVPINEEPNIISHKEDYTVSNDDNVQIDKESETLSHKKDCTVSNVPNVINKGSKIEKSHKKESNVIRTKTIMFLKQIKNKSVKNPKIHQQLRQDDRYDAKKIYYRNQLFNHSFDKLSSIAQDFLLLQLKMAARKKKALRYTSNEKRLALTLMNESPEGYKLLQRIFNLPSKRTLYRLIKN